MPYDEQIAIIQEAKKGKKIQRAFRKPPGTEQHWTNCTQTDSDGKKIQIDFNFDVYDYRVTPEPLEFWCNIYDDVDRRALYVVHSSKELAIKCDKPGAFRVAVHMREVVE